MKDDELQPSCERATRSLEASVGLEWACLGHDPRTWWGLGKLVDGKMKPIATVMRGDSGKWAVYLGGRWSCTEPSRKLAMQAAEQLVEANPEFTVSEEKRNGK